MKPAIVIRIVLILLGIFGPLQATAEKEKSIPLPPMLGGLGLVTGSGLIAVGYKR